MSDDFDNIKFDKLIQQKYAEHESAVPEYLWKNIDGAASQIKTATLSKRIFWYRWLTLSLVLTIFGIVLYYQTNSSENKNVSQIAKNEIKTNELIIGTESEIIPNLTNKEENKLKKSKKIGLNKKINSEKIQQKNLKITSKKRVTLNQKEDSNNYFESSNENITTKETKSILNNKLIEENPKDNFLPESKINHDNPKLNEEKISSTQEENLQVINNKTSDIEINSTDNEIIDIEENVIKQETIPVDQINNTVLPISPEVSNPINNYDKDTILIDSTNIIEVITDKTDTSAIIPENNLTKINISLLFIPGLSTVGIIPKSNSSKIYNSSKENHFQYSAGVNLGYQISNKFSVSVGVGYRKFNNEFKQDAARPNELPMLINPTNNSVTINSSLGTILIDDVGSFNFAGDDEDDVFLDDEDDFADLNFKEEYSFILLDLPLALNYEIGKGKLKLLVGGGLTTSIVINNKSKIEISNVYAPESPLIIENFHDTKKITLSGMVSVGLKYNLSRHISLLILPSYNKTIMNINNNNSSEIKPTSMSFSTGIGYQF